MTAGSPRQGFDAGGELGVAGGEAAHVVAGERNLDPIPSDIDIRVMECLLGGEGDLGDEAHSFDEVAEGEGSPECLAVELPFGVGRSESISLCSAEDGHGT